MVWMLLRLATRTTQWLAIATSQLAANALSSILPAGAAAGATLQVRMLSDAGIETATAASGMTAFTLLQFATVAIVPVLLLPAVLAGVLQLDPGLFQALVIGAIAFVAILAIVGVLAVVRPAVARVGQVVQSTRNRMRRKHPPMVGLPDRLVSERNMMARTLGQSWRRAVILSVGRVAFDYLALLAAVAAVGRASEPVADRGRVRVGGCARADPDHPGRSRLRRGRPHGCAHPGRDPGERGRVGDAALPARGVLGADDRRPVRLRVVPPDPPPAPEPGAERRPGWSRGVIP